MPFRGYVSRYCLAFGMLWSVGFAQPASAPEKKDNNPFVTGPASPASSYTLTPELKKEILDALGQTITTRAFVPGVDLNKWPEFLKKHQEAVDESKTEASFVREVNAALKDFGISHIRFSAPRAALARVRVSSVGIGVSVRSEEAGLVITYVFPDSPADKASLKVGDTITTIEGAAASGADLLQGEKDTEVSIKVKPKEGAERELKVKRDTYSTVRPDTVTWPTEDTALVKIHSFTRGYNKDNIETLISEAAKAKFLVLDLRSNGGGAINNLQHLLSLLMPDNTVIGTFIYKSTSEAYADAHGGQASVDVNELAKSAKNSYRTKKGNVPPFSGKIAVLVNKGSASASEICAWALKENLGSLVVGQESRGAVLASVYRKLPAGFEVQYPISDYVTAKGVRLEKNPIKPDIVVTEPATDKVDPVLDAAIAKLKA